MVFSTYNPCGWVPGEMLRTVERGKKKGFMMIRFGGSYKGRRRKRPVAVDPDFVKFKGESTPPFGGETILRKLNLWR